MPASGQCSSQSSQVTPTVLACACGSTVKVLFTCTGRQSMLQHEWLHMIPVVSSQLATVAYNVSFTGILAIQSQAQVDNCTSGSFYLFQNIRAEVESWCQGACMHTHGTTPVQVFNVRFACCTISQALWRMAGNLVHSDITTHGQTAGKHTEVGRWL